jgi:hypothetical protein
VKQAFEKGRLTFDYDDQPVAYELAQRYCDSAIIYLDRAATMPSSTLAVGDAWLFQGNLSKWKKFAYGQKARLFNRFRKKASYNTSQADSVIKYANLAMSSNADDAIIKFDATNVNVEARNFFGPTRNNMGNSRWGFFPMSVMNGDLNTAFATVKDPRALYLIPPSPDNVHRGIIAANGVDYAAATQKTYSVWGVIGQTAAPAGGVDTGARTFFKNFSPFPIMTFAEMQFLKAEANFRKGNAAAALVAYRDGIDAHIEFLNTNFTGYYQRNGTLPNITIPAAAKATYLASPIVVPATPAGLTLSKIMNQKYLALLGWGFVETFVDMRIYDYDEVNIYPGWVRLPINLLYPDNGGKLMERVRPRYNSEFLWNLESLRAIGGLEPDYHTKKCWFSLP